MPATFELDEIRAMFAESCPGTRVTEVVEVSGGYTSRQWLFRTDEGPLMLKVPVRQADPEHLRHLIVATRAAAELGLPVSRFRAFVPACGPHGVPVLVQEYVVGERASDVWKSMAVDERVTAAAELGRWVAVLHTGRGPAFGDLLGRTVHASATEQAAAIVDAAGGALASVDLPVPGGWSALRERLETGIAEIGDVPPSLCHRDIYLDNVVFADGIPVRLLDFEHARYSDQYAEFGKLTDLLFERYPETERPFMAAYREIHPWNDATRQRIHIHCGLYSVQACCYLLKHQKELVPVYLDRIRNWFGQDDNL